MSAVNEQTTFECYKIEPEQMMGANTYIPILAKSALIELIAEHCISKMEVSAQISDEETMDMPPMYKENTEIKSRFLMGVFVKLYLRGTWEMDEPDNPEEKNLPDELNWRTWLIPVEEYDKWAGGHVFGQIEQFKRLADLKDICFNILADYKDFEKRLNAEVYSMINVMNDPATRQIVAMQINMTPEKMEETMKQLEAAKAELEEYQNMRNAEKGAEESENG